MNKELQSFLNSTERTSCSLVPQASKSIKYPFLYLSKLTTVELEYLAEREIISRSALDDTYLPIYLKTDNGSYRLLGYIKLCFNSIIMLNCLRHQDIRIKSDKDTETNIVSLLDSLLLT